MDRKECHHVHRVAELVRSSVFENVLACFPRILGTSAEFVDGGGHHRYRQTSGRLPPSSLLGDTEVDVIHVVNVDLQVCRHVHRVAEFVRAPVLENVLARFLSGYLE